MYCVRCIDCHKLRLGEKKLGGDVAPRREECPRCRGTGYTVPAYE